MIFFLGMAKIIQKRFHKLYVYLNVIYTISNCLILHF